MRAGCAALVGGKGIGAFDLCHAHGIGHIPFHPPAPLGVKMVNLGLPGADGGLVGPIGIGDAKAIRPARAFMAKIAKKLMN